MGHPYLLAIVVSGAIIQCCKFTNAGSTETDRAAIERADQAIGWQGAPDPELFAQSITDVRNRFGDTAAGVLIDRVLAREPCYAPAHLARAESLFRHGRHEDAVVEGNLALQCSNRNSSRAQLRSIHNLLSRAYLLTGELRKAWEQGQWLAANP